MARGMVNGEPIVSQASTEEFREGHARIFGNKGPQRGKWVLDPVTGRLVDAASYVAPPEKALDAPIMSGRFYEDAAPSPLDGSEINSRRKYEEHCRRHGVTNSGDYKQYFKEKEKERAQHYTGTHQQTRKEIRETLGRTIYEMKNKRRSR